MTVIPLITAAEGFPALERLVRGAEQELVLSFRIFDPETRLRSPDLLQEGMETWADLIADADARGVRLRILLNDFDPLFTMDLHRLAWRSASQFASVVNGDAQILCAPHGQTAGRLWHLLMRGRLREALNTLRTDDNARLTPVQRLALQRGPKLRPVTHHQKFAIADGEHVVIGGLDIDERRYDTTRHDRDPEDTWHDISVELRDSDFAGALYAHFADCWNASLDCGCTSLAAKAERITLDGRPQSPADRRLLRTFSAPCGGFARLSPECRVTDHEDTLIRLFGQAKRSIYIETQFLRHAPIADALVRAAKAQPALNLTILLPLAPERVLFNGDDGFDARHAHALQVDALKRLQNAFGDRLAVLTPVKPSKAGNGDPSVNGSSVVYLHSKVTLIDGEYAIIGSANLNGRSLRWDSEASILLRDPEFTESLIHRLCKAWLCRPDHGDPWKAQTWNEATQADSAVAPDDRTGFLLPYPIDKAAKFSRRMLFMPDDMF